MKNLYENPFKKINQVSVYDLAMSFFSHSTLGITKEKKE